MVVNVFVLLRSLMRQTLLAGEGTERAGAAPHQTPVTVASVKGVRRDLFQCSSLTSNHFSYRQFPLASWLTVGQVHDHVHCYNKCFLKVARWILMSLVKQHTQPKIARRIIFPFSGAFCTPIIGLHLRFWY